MAKKILKLGTRTSLLATAQSSLVAQEIERFCPDVKVELIGIVTTGDKIQNMPLSQVDGKEFFVKEIDEALLSGKIDFAAHSLKDLSLTRPKSLVCAAIPKRENPRDIVIFNKAIIEKVKRNEVITIGTSSPRRLENIPTFLEQALPQWGKLPQLKFIEIRGNVNTRLERIHLDQHHEKYLDGVVLALAGLNRLAQAEGSKSIIQKLLLDCPRMILPLDKCPSAPGQGALAIECRQNDHETQAILNTIHCSKTADLVNQERNILAKWGGGCHQRFGATAEQYDDGIQILYIRGLQPDNKFIEQQNQLNMPPYCSQVKTFWDGSQFKSQMSALNTFSFEDIFNSPSAIFVAHSRAFPEKFSHSNTGFTENHIWTSGTKSWLALAKRGIWVEGCTENLGTHYLESIHLNTALTLKPLQNWTVLTHDQSDSKWQGTNVIPTYQSRFEIDDLTVAKISAAQYLYWASGLQFKTLGKYAANDAIHACGMGHTATILRHHGIKHIYQFLSAEHWQKWLGI